MPDSTFVTHVLDLVEPALGPVQARAMMGGHLVFCAGVSVALLSDDRLYLKVDAQTQERFAHAGGEPFVYEHKGRSVQMSYWSPPDGALEDPEEMRPWALLALEAALRSARPAGRRSKKPAPRAAAKQKPRPKPAGKRR
ncbi:MAG: TfoX/Sxy family protein [Myxococcales bacterium]